MLEPRRITSNIKPKTFVNLWNGKWYYNYDIQSEVVTVPSMEEGGEPTEETRYSYIQVKMAGKPDYKRCVEYVIREHITQSQEFDLINSCNRAAFNMLSDEEADKAGTDYLEYLNKVSEIKAKVKSDFE